MTAVLQRLTALEQNNVELQESNKDLRESNKDLRGSNDRLEVLMRTTMEAVIGVRHMVNIYLFYLTYFGYRIALQSTKFEIEFFSTWLGIG